MPQITLTQDLELNRKILIRTEEVLANDGPKGPPNYKFAGYSNDMVGYNVEALHHKGLIEARIPSERTGKWACWPVGLTTKGQVFLYAAKNENVWKKATEQIRARGIKSNLKEMEKMLLEKAGMRLSS